MNTRKQVCSNTPACGCRNSISKSPCKNCSKTSSSPFAALVALFSLPFPTVEQDRDHRRDACAVSLPWVTAEAHGGAVVCSSEGEQPSGSVRLLSYVADQTLSHRPRRTP